MNDTIGRRRRSRTERGLRIAGIFCAVAAIGGGVYAQTLAPSQAEQRDADEAARSQHGSDAGTVAIIASWRDGQVSQSEYDDWLRYQGREDSPGTRQAEIERMLATRELAAAAEARGADKESAVLLRKLEEKMLFDAYRSWSDSQVNVTDAEVEALIRENPEAFRRPHRVRLRNIYKRFPPDADTEFKESMRVEMSETLQRLRAGADFAETALQISESENRFRGGAIPVVAAGQLRPEVDAIAMALKEGEVSEILETADGLTILYCEEVFPAEEFSADEKRRRAASAVRTRRVQEHWQEHRREILRKAQPVFDFDAARASDGDAVVLRFRNERLTAAEFQAILGRLQGADGRSAEDSFLRERLEEHVVRATAIERARVRGMLENAESQAYLRHRTAGILAAGEAEARVEARLRPPSADDAAAHFKEHGDRFMRPPHYEVAVLRITIEGDDPRPAFEKIRAVLRQIRSGEFSFAEAARDHSDHPSAAQGGELGWISKRDLAGLGQDPQQALIGSLRVGDVSDPVRDHQFLWLLHLKGLQDERPMTWEEARSDVESYLRRKQLRALQEQLTEEMRDSLQVRLRSDDGLSKPTSPDSN